MTDRRAAVATARYAKGLGFGFLGAVGGVVAAVVVSVAFPLVQMWLAMTSGSGGMGGVGISELYLLVGAAVGFISAFVWAMIASSGPRD